MVGEKEAIPGEENEYEERDEGETVGDINLIVEQEEVKYGRRVSDVDEDEEDYDTKGGHRQ